MKTFKLSAAQGDVMFLKLDEAPDFKGYEEVRPEANGDIILTHSETGHHHVMEADTASLYRLPDEPYEALLIVDKPTELKHLRDHDTHEAIKFEEGAYRVRRQRQAVPFGAANDVLKPLTPEQQREQNKYMPAFD